MSSALPRRRPALGSVRAPRTAVVRTCRSCCRRSTPIGPTSRAELAREVGVTKVTVSRPGVRAHRRAGARRRARPSTGVAPASRPPSSTSTATGLPGRRPSTCRCRRRLRAAVLDLTVTSWCARSAPRRSTPTRARRRPAVVVELVLADDRRRCHLPRARHRRRHPRRGRPQTASCAPPPTWAGPTCPSRRVVAEATGLPVFVVQRRRCRGPRRATPSAPAARTWSSSRSAAASAAASSSAASASPAPTSRRARSATSPSAPTVATTAAAARAAAWRPGCPSPGCEQALDSAADADEALHDGRRAARHRPGPVVAALDLSEVVLSRPGASCSPARSCPPSTRTLRARLPARGPRLALAVRLARRITPRHRPARRGGAGPLGPARGVGPRPQPVPAKHPTTTAPQHHRPPPHLDTPGTESPPDEEKPRRLAVVALTSAALVLTARATVAARQHHGLHQLDRRTRARRSPCGSRRRTPPTSCAPTSRTPSRPRPAPR